jgi:hypothetical protein
MSGARWLTRTKRFDELVWKAEGEVVDTSQTQSPAKEAAIPASIGEGTQENAAAWQRLENGRFQPRRIRGSYHGRELG